MFQLSQDAAGKNLILRVKHPNSLIEKMDVNNAYLGGASQVMLWLFIDNVYALVFVVFSFLMGTCMLVIALCLQKQFFGEMCKALLNLSAFIFAVAFCAEMVEKVIIS